MARWRTSPRWLLRLQQLVWCLIYGGLLSLVLGLATERIAPGQGQPWMLCGGLAAALGVLLIFVRSALQPHQDD
ncbi:MAG: hypothetical protein EKK45_08815 [Curvibacter sp.]|nr:MAG: hypothetical protein EKK45_08815 [Curvibacter sp.]